MDWVYGIGLVVTLALLLWMQVRLDHVQARLDRLPGEIVDGVWFAEFAHPLEERTIGGDSVLATCTAAKALFDHAAKRDVIFLDASDAKLVLNEEPA